MSNRMFDIPTMIAISDPWADPAKDKPLLLSIPLTAGLVPIIEGIHKDLLRLHITTGEIESTLRSLTERAYSLDGSFDGLFKTLYAIVTGWAAMVADAQRETLEALLDTIAPEGLAVTQRTYLAEAGNVELAASRITPEMETALKEIVVDGKSAFNLFNEWVAVGRKLGDVERERVRLREKKSDANVTARDILNARFKWIRTVNVLDDLLALESDIPEETKLRILQPLRAAESKLAKKRSTVDPTEGLDPTEAAEDETIETPIAKADG